MPRVSVLMSVYNDGQYLKQSIDSILNQTFTDFEFIIIDDGSTDNSRRVIEGYTDPRIKFIINEKNLTIPISINKGLKLTQGEYIARMDADDISLPDRLAKQVKFMDEHTDIAVSSSAIQIMGSNQIWLYPISPEECQFNLLFGNVIAQPAAILRRQFFLDHNLFYNPEFTRCSDYELWFRVAQIGKISNLVDTLLLYRVEQSQILKHKTDGQKFPILVRKTILKNLGVDYSEAEFALHQKVSLGEKLNLTEVIKLKKWFKKIKEANSKSGIFYEGFSNFLDKKYSALSSPLTLIKNYFNQL